MFPVFNHSRPFPYFWNFLLNKVVVVYLKKKKKHGKPYQTPLLPRTLSIKSPCFSTIWSAARPRCRFPTPWHKHGGHVQRYLPHVRAKGEETGYETGNRYSSSAGWLTFLWKRGGTSWSWSCAKLRFG